MHKYAKSSEYFAYYLFFHFQQKARSALAFLQSFCTTANAFPGAAGKSVKRAGFPVRQFLLTHARAHSQKQRPPRKGTAAVFMLYSTGEIAPGW